MIRNSTIASRSALKRPEIMICVPIDNAVAVRCWVTNADAVQHRLGILRQRPLRGGHIVGVDLVIPVATSMTRNWFLCVASTWGRMSDRRSPDPAGDLLKLFWTHQNHGNPLPQRLYLVKAAASATLALSGWRLYDVTRCSARQYEATS
jgi:hypothetical protein